MKLNLWLFLIIASSPSFAVNLSPGHWRMTLAPTEKQKADLKKARESLKFLKTSLSNEEYENAKNIIWTVQLISIDRCITKEEINSQSILADFLSDDCKIKTETENDKITISAKCDSSQEYKQTIQISSSKSFSLSRDTIILGMKMSESNFNVEWVGNDCADLDYAKGGIHQKRKFEKNNPIFNPYIKRFEEIGRIQLNQPNFKVEDIPINFGKLYGPAGVCFTTQDRKKEILIDKEIWDRGKEDYKEMLIFHELGHCKLNRRHFNDLGTDQNGKNYPLSIMASENKSEALYKKRKSEYHKELFEKKAPDKYYSP